MEAFNKVISSGVETLFRQTLKSVIHELAEQISSKIEEDEKPTADDIVLMWNNIMKESKLKISTKKNSKEKDVDPDATLCEHIFAKGEKAKQRCTEAVSDKSETKRYCSKHYVSNETKKKSNKDSDSDGRTCEYTLKKGEKEGQECGKNVSPKSHSKKFCSKHLKEEEKDEEDKPKKKKKNSEDEESDDESKKVSKDKKEKDKKKKMQINAKKYKNPENKEFEGLCYFENNDTIFVLEAKSKTVKGKEIDGKIEALDDEEIERVTASRLNYKGDESTGKKVKDNKKGKKSKKDDKKKVVEEEDEEEEEEEDDEVEDDE